MNQNYKPMIRRKATAGKSVLELFSSMTKEAKEPRERKVKASLIKADGTPRKLKLGR